MRVFCFHYLIPFFLTLSGGEFFQDLNFRLENHQLKGITETVAQNGAMHISYNESTFQKLEESIDFTKGQIISEINLLVLNSSKKRTKNFCPSSQGRIWQIFRSFFGRIENKIVC